MNDRKAFFASTVGLPSESASHDPGDPRTWWIASAGKDTNRIPLRGNLDDHALTLAGVPATRFYNEPKFTVAVASAVAAYYGLDSPVAVLDVYNVEAHALGQKMIYGDDSMPTVDFREPLIGGPADLAKLKAPNWLDSPRVRHALELQKLYASMGQMPVSFCAPFSLAVALRSYPKLIRDMRRDPAFAHAFFTCLVDEILPSYLELIKNYCGLSRAAGADAWAAFPNLTPDLMEEWLVPYATRLADNCQKFGMTATTTGGGVYCEERLEKFDKATLHRCFDIQTKLNGGLALSLAMGRWHELPLEAVAEYVAPHLENGITARISASVNARLMLDGPVEAIVDNIKRFVDVLGRDYNLSLSLTLPAGTPSEHVHAGVAGAHSYGRFPISHDLDAIELRVPERESFPEFVEKMSAGAGLGV